MAGAAMNWAPRASRPVMAEAMAVLFSRSCLYSLLSRVMSPAHLIRLRSIELTRGEKISQKRHQLAINKQESGNHLI
jgi:hypothetical protein